MSKKHGKNKARRKPPASTPVKRATPALPLAAAPKTTPPPANLVPKNAAAKKPFPIKTAALAVVMLVAVALGAWFALSPALEKNKALEQQNALIDSIENGGGEIVLDAAFAAVDVDFYDDKATTEPDAPTTAGTAQTSAPDTEQTAAPAETAAPVDTVVTGIGVLTIDKISAKLPVTDGVTSAQLKVAVGHVRGTPEIGSAGNAVIAGHRSYTYGQYFNRLGEMEVGDVISYQPKNGEAMKFAVYEILVVLPDDPAALYQPEDKNTITLLTCTPIRTATHRLLVRAELINR